MGQVNVFTKNGKWQLPAKDQCSEHEGNDFVYMSCDAEWTIKNHEGENSNGIVKHSGNGNYRAPFPIHATSLSKEKLQD